MFAKLKKITTNQVLVGAFILLGLATLLTSTEKDVPTSFAPEPASADTFIPAGHVLVPLEISNAESLASLVGDLGGVVDLYLATTETQKGGLKVGSKLKILRAPLNPQQYAVLVKDNDSSRLMSFAGPFIAVIQNPDAKGTLLTPSAQRPVQIQYQN